MNKKIVLDGLHRGSAWMILTLVKAAILHKFGVLIQDVGNEPHVNCALSISGDI